MAFKNIFNIYSIFLRAITCFSLLTVTSSFEEQTVTLKDGICKLDYGLGQIDLRTGGVVILKDDDYFTSWTGRYEYNCKFLVKLKGKDRNDWGIYAVIQHLNFRESADSQCMDFVEFSKPHQTSQVVIKLLDLKYRSPRKFCNRLSPGMWLGPPSPFEDSDVEESWTDPEVAPNAYVTYDETLAVQINVARERLLPGHKLTFTIAFTAFRKKCYKRDMLDESIQCRPGECISNLLKNDGVQNCPYRTCVDEDGCSELRQEEGQWPKDLIGSGIGARVTFGAVAAIILILLKFALCLWVCKRISRRRRAAAPPRAVREVISVPQDPPETAPTAPPIADIDSKDMPPSYDSLFPTEAVEMSTINSSQSSTNRS